MRLRITNGIVWGLAIGGDYPRGAHVTWLDLWTGRICLEIVIGKWKVA